MSAAVRGTLGRLVVMLVLAAPVSWTFTAPARADATAPPAPVELCRTADPRLAELSGLASDGTHRFAVSDGGSSAQAFLLGPDCEITDVRGSDIDPNDVEDLALAGDGTLWLADIGDNRLRRDTIALIALPPTGPARLHRLAYPDGPHDAESLLLTRDAIPIIVTKDLSGSSGVYLPVGPLAEPGPTPLRRTGVVGVRPSDTVGGPVGPGGGGLLTGAATTVDHRVVALRTYTDAWLYPAPDGDIVAALQREPVRIPLPDEPQGEAIAFEPDGTLLSASESTEVGTGALRAVPGAASVVAASPAAAPPVATPPGAEQPAADSSEADRKGMPATQAGLLAIALAALIMFGIGALRR